MRCFVAIEINQECRNALKNVAEQLDGLVGDQKWVEPRNMHMTLKFIGNISRDRLPEVSLALQNACEGTGPFAMEVSGLGAFPRDDRPKVVFARVKEETGTLVRLAEWVESGLAKDARIKRDKRKFVPHITLFRHRSGHPVPPVGKMEEKLQNTCFGTVEVEEIVLMKSELTPSGPVYSTLDEFGL